MSKNATQSYRLFQLLKSGNMIKKETVAKELGVIAMSVPVYIFELKKQHKVEILSVREGRKVVGYKLVSKDATVPEFRKNSTAYPKAAKPAKVRNNKKSLISKDGEVPVLDKDAEITQIGEREFSDIADSLGVDTNHSFE